MEEQKDVHFKELIEKGKKSGILTYKEIIDVFEGVDLTPEQIDDIYDDLAKNGIEVVADSS